MNQNTALSGPSGNPANVRNPFGYYDANPWCLQDISGSSWILANLLTEQYETDSTMTVTCT